MRNILHLLVNFVPSFWASQVVSDTLPWVFMDAELPLFAWVLFKISEHNVHWLPNTSRNSFYHISLSFGAFSMSLVRYKDSARLIRRFCHADGWHHVHCAKRSTLPPSTPRYSMIHGWNRVQVWILIREKKKKIMLEMHVNTIFTAV